MSIIFPGDEHYLQFFFVSAFLFALMELGSAARKVMRELCVTPLKLMNFGKNQGGNLKIFHCQWQPHQQTEVGSFFHFLE